MLPELVEPVLPELLLAVDVESLPVELPLLDDDEDEVEPVLPLLLTVEPAPLELEPEPLEPELLEPLLLAAPLELADDALLLLPVEP